MAEQRQSILLVEDDVDHSELFRRAFSTWNDRFEIIYATRLAEARYIVAQRRIDIILIDLGLPDGSGNEILSEVPNIPVVVLTSRGSEEAAVKALKLGAMDYIVKPASSFEELPRMAERSLREWQQNHEKKRLERELRSFFEVSPALMCVASLQGRFLRVNPAFTQRLGWSDAELLARDYIEFVEPEDHPVTRDVMQRLTKGESIAGFTNRYRCKDGTVRQLEWNCIPALDEGVAFATAWDVTERVAQAEREQKQAVAKAKLSVLTPRERQVLELVVDGLPNKAIAAQLELNEKTVEKHRSRLMRKLKCRSLASLVRVFVAAQGI